MSTIYYHLIGLNLHTIPLGRLTYSTLWKALCLKNHVRLLVVLWTVFQSSGAKSVRVPRLARRISVQTKMHIQCTSVSLQPHICLACRWQRWQTTCKPVRPKSRIITSNANEVSGIVHILWLRNNSALTYFLIKQMRWMRIGKYKFLVAISCSAQHCCFCKKSYPTIIKGRALKARDNGLQRPLKI